MGRQIWKLSRASKSLAAFRCNDTISGMNTKEQAAMKLRDFFQSQDKFLLFNGTHQHQKHPLAIAAAVEVTQQPATILFRSNHSDNTGTFLRAVGITEVPQPGAFLRVGKHRLCVDTINQASWRKSPRPIDIAIVYPVGSLTGDKGDECVQDLICRNASKILLVTGTDNKDLAWVNQFNPVRITYDAEAERPDYHEEIRKIGVGTMRADIPKNLSDYAKSTPPELLVQLYCRRCGSGRWARLNRPYPGKMALKNAKGPEYTATCLKCGDVATDNYNWYGRD